MRRLILCAAVLAVAGCGSQAAAHSAPPSPSPATVAAYSDAHACRAFHEATTTGVPASAAGENTLTWLQSQAGNASPALQAALQRFYTAWGNPANVARIGRATRAVKRVCAGT